MSYNKVRFAAGVLTVTLAFTGTGISAKAVSLSSSLPVAGIGLSLEEGVSLKTVEHHGDYSREIVEPISFPAPVVKDVPVEEDYSNLVIARVDSYVNVRSIPGEDGEIVGKLYDKSVGNFLEEENGWYKIQSGNCTGYVKAEYCITGEEANALAKEVGRRIATVTTETLNVRKEATTDSSILGQVPIEEVLTVTEELDGWVQVKIEEGKGYVSLDYVTLSTEFVQAESREEEKARLAKEEAERQEALAASQRAREQAAAAAATASAGEQVQEAAPIPSADSTNLGQQVADYAVQFVGNPYVYGGTSLTNGADCSGFVMSVYAKFGVSLPHSAAADRKKGIGVGNISNAIPGDIICYSGHVGIYIGNGQIVHASNSRTGIIISNANYDTIIDVRRIF
ncbi:MAG: SH3 domain-containing protein [Lachnospiraceae bacterium]|nr:SH3 domain-containing protein [Lachnospiraceae bacterium]MDD7027346.1 SH3 domain-containing protein [Lachnospiraceae bacterium]MDY5700032.1 SH3 domain-containing protein [Lachnospiraceae bacterium]